MKKTIHPIYYPKAKIICSCGNVLTVGSTKKEMHIEICSKCHPFFTGEQKLIDSGGRLGRFKRLLEKKKALTIRRKPKKSKKK